MTKINKTELDAWRLFGRINGFEAGQVCGSWHVFQQTIMEQVESAFEMMQDMHELECGREKE